MDSSHYDHPLDFWIDYLESPIYKDTNYRNPHVEYLITKYRSIFDYSSTENYINLVGKFLINNYYTDASWLHGNYASAKWLRIIFFFMKLYDIEVGLPLDGILETFCVGRNNFARISDLLIVLEYSYPNFRKFIGSNISGSVLKYINEDNNKTNSNQINLVKRTKFEKKQLNYIRYHEMKLVSVPFWEIVLDEYTDEFLELHITIYLFELMRIIPENPYIRFIINQAKVSTHFNKNKTFRDIKNIIKIIKSDPVYYSIV